jgi:hypothetical protein
VTLHFIAYYSVLVTCIVLFVAGSRALDLRFASYTAMAFMAGVLLHAGPGYAVATGQVLPSIDRGLDEEIYWIFVAFTPTLAGGLLLGRWLVREHACSFEVREAVSRRMLVALIAILFYGVIYFSWLGDVPLNLLLREPANLLGAVIRRIEVTHQLGDRPDLPVPLRYWRIVLQIFGLIVFLYFAQRWARHRSYWPIMAVLAALLVYSHLFTLEKAPVLYAASAVFLLPLSRGVQARTVALYLAVMLPVIYLTYIWFMGSSTEVWYGPVEEIGFRMASQAASVYAQVLYVREYGFIWYRGLDLQFARYVIDNDFIDLSVWAYQMLFVEMTRRGLIGAAGGNALAQLYFMFSWFALPLFLGFVVVFAAADGIFANAVRWRTVEGEARRVLNAFYLSMIPYMCVGFVGSVFVVFGVPILLNSTLIFILLFFACFVQLGTIRIVTKR